MAILVASPLTDDIIRRIFAKELDVYFNVVIGDCLQWVRKTDAGISFTRGHYRRIVSITSEDGLNDFIEREKPAFVLDFIGKGKFTKTIQETCRKVGALYITHLLVPNPAPVSAANPVRSFLLSPMDTLKRACSHFSRRLRNIAPGPPDIALLAGEASRNPWTASAKKVIFTPTPAVFELKKVLEEESVGDNKFRNYKQGYEYIVFIDDCIAESFDFLLGDHEPIVKGFDYYHEINAFFAEIEKITGLPVIIAAHPNGSEISGYESRFDGRKVVFGETARLVVSSKVAMTHYSSAISYPVMLRKPIVLISFSELQKTAQGVTQAYMHKILRCKMAKLEDRRNLSEIITGVAGSVDLDAYARYERMYISNLDTVPDHVMAPLVKYLQGCSDPC